MKIDIIKIYLLFFFIFFIFSCDDVGKWTLIKEQSNDGYNAVGETTPSPNPTSPPGAIVIDMVVNDTANAANWSIMTNIQVNDEMFGDRTYLIATLPPIYAGSTWIRTAADSKTYTDTTLVTFTVTADVEVLIVHDDRITTRPTWLTSGWVDTGNDITDNLGVDYSVFSKNYTADSSVSLGPNGAASGVIGYSIIVQ